MKNRRYFTCPIQILYMMKEFKVKFKNVLGVQIKDLELKDLLCTNLVMIAFVDPKSESIFEQKKGDIGIRQEDDYIAIAKAQEFEDFEENNGTTSPSRYWKIIMRNNKHFFIGKLENETQN